MDGLGDEIIEEYRPQQDEGNNIDEWSKNYQTNKTIALIFFAYYWLPNYLIDIDKYLIKIPFLY